MDLFDRLNDRMGPLGSYMDQADGYFAFPKLEGEISSRMNFKGKEHICWSLNNYLGLANHPEVRRADAQAAADYGMAYPMGARMMSGQTSEHEALEKDLAAFVQKPAAYLLNFGYQGMVSAIDALVARHDVVVYDAESHACIVDGVRLHQGKRFAFKHNDMPSLCVCLERATAITSKSGGAILVISEGVFGMRGDQGRLKEIVALKSQYQFRLLVDDAHGFGTLGATGAGAGEEQGVQDEIDIYFSTFAKSMASIGAFFAAEKKVIDFLRYNMRSQIFAKSLPMAFVKGAQVRLNLLQTQPALKERLWENVTALQNGLKARGLEIGETNSCVTPVYLEGDTEEAMTIVRDLRENYRIFCSMVVYPVIPKGMIILRLIPTAVHTEEDIAISLDAFTEVAAKLKTGYYRKLATTAG
ncbi:MAG: aminotransferase class I/II-fold pyridoxal phosphate-dependent enzyme [Saprospiraceae bacterium]|nr:aminotransferase class I/II-fold pyridoxal phosphate-dependent enzyme [Saprospiraceae bacterium]